MLCRRLLLTTLLLILAEPLAAADLAGRVVAIADGDTLTLLTAEQRQVRIRLAGIDAPESQQPYGTRARQELSSLAFRQGRAGRGAGHRPLWPDGRHRHRRPGQRQCRAGPPRRRLGLCCYNRDPALPRLEAAARRAGFGLWALPAAERMRPWEWRRARR